MNLTKVMRIATQAISGDFSGIVTAMQPMAAGLAKWLAQQNKSVEEGGQLRAGEDIVFLSVSPTPTGTMLVNLFFYRKETDESLFVTRIEQLGPLEDILQQLKADHEASA